MIEFHIKIRIDTQSPEIAYGQLCAALSHSGLVAEVSDVWLENNRPLPTAVAHRIDEVYRDLRKEGKNIDEKITLRATERFEDRYVDTGVVSACCKSGQCCHSAPAESFSRRKSDADVF